MSLLQPDTNIPDRADAENLEDTPTADPPPDNTNGSSPVSRLPPELLAYIFRFHAVVDSSMWLHKGQYSTWVAVTHVCRYWRDVALGEPRLWDYLVLSSAGWTIAGLRRSKPLPVIINATFDGRPLRKALEIALCEISRARELVLSVTIVKRLVELIKDCPAPFLETLSLTQSVTSYTLPNDVFEGQTPKLRSLTLMYVGIKWSSALLRPGLVHLEIRDPCREDLPGIDQVLDVLETMPRLQTLILVHTLRDDQESGHGLLTDTDTANYIANLPLIRKFQFAGSPIQGAQLLNAISFPIDATLKLDYDRFPSGVRSLTYIADSLARHVLSRRDGKTRPQMPHFQILRLDTSWPLSFLLHASFATDSPNSSDLDCTPQLSVDVTWTPNSPPPIAEIDQMLARVCSLPPFENVESLHVLGNVFAIGVEWKAAFKSMNNVSRLFVKGPAAYGFGHAFNHNGNPDESLSDHIETTTPSTSSDVAGHGALPIFPRIKSVVVEEADFPGSSLFTDLRDGIAATKDSRSLETLVIHHCDISRSHVAELRESGLDSLEWDGFDNALSQLSYGRLPESSDGHS